ncbi:MAG: hypothetical protein WAP52_02120 [Candidatus Sungiibacteriota bacterium]
MTIHHQTLSAGRWQAFSLAEQMGNIGSEISRANRWQGKNQEHFTAAADRALELMDLTIRDSRWRARLKELTRTRELFIDALLGGAEYRSSLADLDRYFFAFAFAARLKR